MKTIHEKILTRRKVGQSHREDTVIIDWTGISEEDLRFLATQAILYDTQAKLSRGDWNVEVEVIEIKASEIVHRDILPRKKYDIPAAWLSGEDIPEGKWEKVKEPAPIDALAKMLAGLSPEELKVLLS